MAVKILKKIKEKLIFGIITHVSNPVDDGPILSQGLYRISEYSAEHLNKISYYQKIYQILLLMEILINNDYGNFSNIYLNQ